MKLPPDYFLFIDRAAPFVYVSSDAEAVANDYRRCVKYGDPARTVLRFAPDHDWSCLRGKVVCCLGEHNPDVAAQIIRDGALSVYFIDSTDHQLTEAHHAT